MICLSYYNFNIYNGLKRMSKAQKRRENQRKQRQNNLNILVENRLSVQTAKDIRMGNTTIWIFVTFIVSNVVRIILG